MSITRNGIPIASLENTSNTITTEKTAKKPKKSKWRFLYMFLIKMAIFAIIIWSLLTFVLGFHRMVGTNMFPNVKDGDLVITYKLEDIYTKDIVQYTGPDGHTYIGRIVGIPSQTIDFPEEGGYLINGQYPSEEIPYQTFAEKNSKITYPIEIQNDEFFILSDFRSSTLDSRSFGPIKKDKIQGKTIFILRRRSF